MNNVLPKTLSRYLAVQSVYNLIISSEKDEIINNFKIALPRASANEIKNHISEMWNYYGRILAEYPFLNNFPNNSNT